MSRFRRRVAKGVPAGGQFTGNVRDEGDVSLGTPRLALMTADEVADFWDRPRRVRQLGLDVEATLWGFGDHLPAGRRDEAEAEIARQFAEARPLRRLALRLGRALMGGAPRWMKPALVQARAEADAAAARV